LFSSKTKKAVFFFENLNSNAHVEDAKEEVRNEYQRHVDDNEHTACMMLASISPKLQRKHENMDTHTMIMYLKELFD
jgi:hypothetical protein